MASRQSMSSILKPPKVRAPLKVIDLVDQDADENTATSSKRKVSFSGMNKIKMYNTCATSLTVNQAPMFDEKNSISSDTLNGDGTKTPGKFDKSDVQIAVESTDCTNAENNGRVIIEYESPSDNMEMTEAKVGKLHESMFLIDNNYDSDCMNSSLDNSETNMEFTEAKVGNIFTAYDMESDFSSTEMSETLYGKDDNNLGTNISTSLPGILKTKIFDKSSNTSTMEFTCANTKSNFAAIETSNMEFTCANTKLNSMNSESCNMEFTCANTKSNYVDTESSNMELTCTTVKLKKSTALNDYSSFSMELTRVPDKQISEDCSELMYEKSIGPDTIYDEKNNSNCQVEIDPNILYTKTGINNDLIHETIVCTLKNSDENDFSDDLSLSTVSMDVDPTLEYNARVENNILLDNSDLVTNEQDSSNSIVVMPTEVENISRPVNITVDNLNKIDLNYLNSKSGIPILPTSSSFVQEISLEKNTDKSSVVKQSFNDHASMLDHSQYIVKKKSMVPEENKQRKYSRKTKSHKELVAEFDLKKHIENHDNVFVATEENQLKKPSFAPTLVFDQSPSFENENTSDKSIINEESQQKIYLRKSIALPNISDDVLSINANEDMSDKSTIDEEIQQNKRYSRKSIAPTKSVHEVQSIYVNEDVSDKSTIYKESRQKQYSRKSIAPTNITDDELSIYENEDMSDKSTTDKIQQNKRYSRKSIAPTKSVHEMQSIYENEDISDKSITDEENQRNRYSRKSIVPTSVVNKVQSIYENDDVLDESIVDEEIQQNKRYSRKSIAPTKSVHEMQSIYENDDISDKSIIDEENQQNRYSRKSFAPTNMAHEVQSIYENDDISDESIVEEKIQQNKRYSRKSLVPISINESALNPSEELIEFEQKRCSVKPVASLGAMTVDNQMHFSSNENVPLKKKYSRKTVGPASFYNKSSEDDMSDNLLSSIESNVSPLISSNMNMKQLCPSNKKQLAIKSEHKSTLLGVINDDDLNSPFRKKSKKSINLTNKSIYIPVENDTDQSGNVEYESKMDVSMEYESKNDNEANISHQKTYMTESIPKEAEEQHTRNENLDGNIKKEKTVVPSNELKVIEKDIIYEPTEDHEMIKGDERSEDNKSNESIKVNDYVNKNNCTLNSKDNSLSHDLDTVTNTLCVEGISNMSITDETNLCFEKLSTGNRKRSYNNRDCAPLSCSSFVSKSNVEDCMNKEFLKESPIKINVAVSTKDSLIEDIVKEESFKENLSSEVLEFLTRWTEQFVEKKLSQIKCTNSEWSFNILDGNLTLTIYFSNDYSFLKVENISFEIQPNAQNEIMMFGIQWILSKYNPKVYKQICFTSRDVELLLKSLLEDVHFISEVMNNMSYVKDLYCVTFKDNKAEIVLHKMMPAPMMVRIEILLFNIHKLSVKDITVDRLFGIFDSKLLEKILENKNKDCKVLQFLIEELRSAI